MTFPKQPVGTVRYLRLRHLGPPESGFDGFGEWLLPRC